MFNKTSNHSKKLAALLSLCSATAGVALPGCGGSDGDADGGGVKGVLASTYLPGDEPLTVAEVIPSLEPREYDLANGMANAGWAPIIAMAFRSMTFSSARPPIAQLPSSRMP